MDRMWLGLALGGVMALGNRGKSTPAAGPEPALRVAQDSASPTEALPPTAWLQGDPADSVYRAARAALDRRDYRQAAELFAQVPVRFPRSGYAADAYYWRAFALYRVGGTGQLHAALAALDTQRDRFPKAATKGDAKALASRIQGELARQGDPAAAARVAEAAEDAGRTPSVPPMPPARPGQPVPPTPPTPPSPPSHPGDDDRGADDDDDTKVAALNA
ncbi:MAG: hypothetical protein ABJC36_11165, partial [Gemmatimonadales bacterium]